MAGHADTTLALPVFTEPVKVLIVVAPYYGTIAAQQLAGARAVLDAVGASHETVEVPGSLELAPAIRIAFRQGDFDGFVALGCVIRGATAHFDVVVGESARGLTMLGLAGAAVGNGILTVEDMGQAEERADPARQDTGGGAAAAALHLIHLTRTIRRKPKGVGFRPN